MCKKSLRKSKFLKYVNNIQIISREPWCRTYFVCAASLIYYSFPWSVCKKICHLWTRKHMKPRWNDVIQYSRFFLISRTTMLRIVFITSRRPAVFLFDVVLPLNIGIFYNSLFHLVNEPAYRRSATVLVLRHYCPNII